MYTIVFTGGVAPDNTTMADFLNRNFKPSDISCVIAADSGLDVLNSLYQYLKEKKININLEPSVILGDMDSVSSMKACELHSNAKFIGYDTDKDYTDTELALVKAKELNPTGSIVLIGGDGGRIDHLFQLLDDFSMACHADVWLLQNQIVYYLKENESYVIKGLEPSHYVSFIRPLSSYSKGIMESRGLMWEGECFRKTGMASVSNRIDPSKGKDVYLTPKEGSFLVILPYEAIVQKI